MVYANVAAGDPILASTVNDVFTSSLNSIVAQGNRNTASSTSSGTTAMGILRLDNLALKSGYAYQFICGNIRATIGTAGSNFKLYLAYSSAGAATTASTEIGRTEQNPPNSTWNWPAPTGWVIPGADTTTASILLAVIRTNTVGASTFTTLADTGGLWLTVICRGVGVSDTGVDI
jgi:hypothetical protein